MAKRNDKDGLYQRKDSPYWWASFKDASGKRVRCSTGTSDRQESEALLSKWKLEAFQQRQWNAPEEVTFQQVILYFLKETKGVKRSHDDDCSNARTLRESFEDEDMRVLTPVKVGQYVAKRKSEGVSNATVNRGLALLSAAINRYNRDFMENLPNPTRGRKLKEPEARIRYLTREEAEMLIAQAEVAFRAPHLPDFIRLAAHTGCRAQEMLGLEWSRVDLEKRQILLEGSHTKTAKRRSVPLNKVAFQAILNRQAFCLEHCPESPWVFCNSQGERICSVKKSFASACRRAGITNFRIHDLRHTCATWLTTARVATAEIRDLLGHSSINMTEKYAHLAPENVRQAVEVLDK
ncbi:tyrosine-type recombinase/integrase [Thiorhodovibrio frisius]|uniref:Site-specific recombinase XerD n=1 Tax=Thiorhodovibrio frisius TaxID=631362 RepID=H8Z5E9_9GAMM|nr:site-specific integrase [Thiorhodovibrio frisius]EIC19495.1 site-specific recombinase XerD [Thiorhodovibrio frisius]WPL20541.1 Tyrosine recombinase XerC [Thiorhodovibrio frisius]